MSTKIEKIESSSLLKLWREMEEKPGSSPVAVFESYDAKFSIRAGDQRAWIIDLEFAFGGPKPKLIDSLRHVIVLPEQRPTPGRRLITVQFDARASDCVEFWPHFAEAILSDAVSTKLKINSAQSLAKTLRSWKKIWPSMGRLSDALILGLFGELVFLRHLLAKLPPSLALASWQGPSARDHDFSIKSTAFEVKASKGNALKVTISNLNQLDDAGLDALYLAYIRLRPSNDKPHSLQSLGEAIQASLADDPELTRQFTSKLGKAGWFRAPREQREGVSFRVIRTSLYPVTKAFPRILRPDLLKLGRGVDLKHYTLNLGACPVQPFSDTQEAELWNTLSGASKATRLEGRMKAP